MKYLKDLLANVHVVKVAGQEYTQHPVAIRDITCSSNEVTQDSLFIAQKGHTHDGHLFIEASIEKGAKAILCEHIPKSIHPQVCYIKVKKTQAEIGKIADHFFDHPSASLCVIGTTGTNGKTSISTLLYRLFSSLGYPSGLISTIENCIGTNCQPARLTTPSCLDLHRMMQQMVLQGVRYVFMECSSHAIDQGRIDGIAFAGGIFTNLTHDHLDYHLNFPNYRDAKKKFFSHYLPKTAFALTNFDDKNGLYMLQNTPARCLTYSTFRIADYQARIIEQSLIGGTEVEINGKRFFSPLIGEFNVYNLAAVFGCASELGVDPSEIALHLSKAEGARGRMEKLRPNSKNIIGIVDYAHTPDAVQHTLKAIRNLKQSSQSLIVVLGCGGDRDKSKRSEMGKFASMLGDKIIFTSDNPRNEDPVLICEQMQETLDAKELEKVEVILDRKKAIEQAIASATENDIVLIAGKGHETYQMIGAEKLPFSDKQIFESIVH